MFKKLTDKINDKFQNSVFLYSINSIPNIYCDVLAQKKPETIKAAGFSNRYAKVSIL